MTFLSAKLRNDDAVRNAAVALDQGRQGIAFDQRMINGVQDKGRRVVKLPESRLQAGQLTTAGVRIDHDGDFRKIRPSLDFFTMMSQDDVGEKPGSLVGLDNSPQEGFPLILE